MALRTAALSLLISLACPFAFAEHLPGVSVPAAKSSRASKNDSLPAPPNLFAEQFMMPADERLQNEAQEVHGFLFVETPDREKNSRYCLVTDFAPNAVKTQIVPGLTDLQGARKWVEERAETAEFEGAEIRRIKIPYDGREKTYYFVGDKGYASLDGARSQIALLKAVVEAQGGNFSAMVRQARAASNPPETPPAVEIKTPAQFEREEKIALKFLDRLDIGNKIFGPLQGVPSGEPITWQSFGETTWRMTNLSKKNFSGQVGFWTNRLVLKGIRFPFNTVDPFVEETGALESNGIDGSSHLDLSAGAEWRPFARNVLVYNFQPWGLPLLEWVRNFRFYIQYFDRKNLKDEILNIRDYDLVWGAQIFYEFGVEPRPLGETAPKTVPDYLRRYVWGEYFGNYYYDNTNFGTEPEGQFDAFILNSSIILGVKLPGIPLPANPVTDELALMPYLRFEHVNNTEHSFPFQNQYFLAGGARWMPFANNRFKENEWLAKTKIFAEWVGIGKVKNGKQDDEAPNAIDYDLRFGINISQKRF